MKLLSLLLINLGALFALVVTTFGVALTPTFRHSLVLRAANQQPGRKLEANRIGAGTCAPRFYATSALSIKMSPPVLRHSIPPTQHSLVFSEKQFLSKISRFC